MVKGESLRCRLSGLLSAELSLRQDAEELRRQGQLPRRLEIPRSPIEASYCETPVSALSERVRASVLACRRVNAGTEFVPTEALTSRGRAWRSHPAEAGGVAVSP